MSLYNQNMSCYCIENKFSDFWKAIDSISDNNIKNSILELLKPYEGSFMYFTESKDLKLLTLDKSKHVEFVSVSRWNIKEIESASKGFLTISPETSQIEINPSQINKLNNISGILIGNKDLAMDTFIELKFFDTNKLKVDTKELILGSANLSIGTNNNVYLGTQLLQGASEALINQLHINADSLKISIGQNQKSVIDAYKNIISIGSNTGAENVKLAGVTVKSMLDNLKNDRGDIQALLNELSGIEAPIYPLYLSTDDIFGSMAASIIEGLEEGTFDLCMHIEDPEHSTCYEGYLSPELSWKVYNLLDSSISNFNLYVQPYKNWKLINPEEISHAQDSDKLPADASDEDKYLSSLKGKSTSQRYINKSKIPDSNFSSGTEIIFNITNHNNVPDLYFRPLEETVNDSIKDSFSVAKVDDTATLLQYEITSSNRKVSYIQVNTLDNSQFKPVTNAQGRSSLLKYDDSKTNTTSAPERFNRLLYQYVKEETTEYENLKGLSINITEFLNKYNYNVYFTARILKRIKVNVETNYCIKPYTVGSNFMNNHKLDFGNGVTACNFAINMGTGTKIITLGSSASFYKTSDIWGVSGIHKDSKWNKLYKDVIVEKDTSTASTYRFNPEISPIYYNYQEFTDTYRYDDTGQEQAIAPEINDLEYGEIPKLKSKGTLKLCTSISPVQVYLRKTTVKEFNKDVDRWVIDIAAPTVYKKSLSYSKDTIHIGSCYSSLLNLTVSEVVNSNFNILEDARIMKFDNSTVSKFNSLPTTAYINNPDVKITGMPNYDIIKNGISGDEKTLPQQLETGITLNGPDKDNQAFKSWWTYANVLKYYNKQNEFTLKSMFKDAFEFSKSYQKYIDVNGSFIYRGIPAPVQLPLYRFDTSGRNDWMNIPSNGQIVVDNDRAAKILFRIPAVMYTGRPGASSFFILPDAYYSIANTQLGGIQNDLTYRGVQLNSVRLNTSPEYTNENSLVFDWIRTAGIKATDEFTRLILKSEKNSTICNKDNLEQSKLSLRSDKELLTPIQQLSPGLLLSNSIWNMAQYINYFDYNNNAVNKSDWFTLGSDNVVNKWKGWNTMYTYFNYLYYEASVSAVRQTDANELDVRYFTISIN